VVGGAFGSELMTAGGERAFGAVVMTAGGGSGLGAEVMTVGGRRCGGHTIAVAIGGERLWLTASQRGDGSLGEVFIRWGKYGTSGAGLLDTYAAALSAGLRHRIPLPDLIRPGLGLWFAPNGRTDDPEIPWVRSAVDYVSRRLAIDWLPYPERDGLGVLTPGERGERDRRSA
jgi:hypothetical protein